MYLFMYERDNIINLLHHKPIHYYNSIYNSSQYDAWSAIILCGMLPFTMGCVINPH